MSRIINKWYFQNKSFTFQWYCTNDYEFFVLVLDDIFKPISNRLKRKKRKRKRDNIRVILRIGSSFSSPTPFISSSTTEEFFWNRHRRGLHESTTGYYEDSSSINPLVAARASKENVGHRLDSIPCVKARRRNWEAKLHIAVTLPPFNLYFFTCIYIYIRNILYIFYIHVHMTRTWHGTRTGTLNICIITKFYEAELRKLREMTSRRW